MARLLQGHGILRPRGMLLPHPGPRVGSDSGGRTAPAPAPPAVTGAIPDQSFVEKTGVQSYDASAHFAGEALTFSLTEAPGGVHMDAAAGILAIDTAATGVLSGARAVVRASNSGGHAESAFNLAIAPAAPAIGALSAQSYTADTGVQDYNIGALTTGDVSRWVLDPVLVAPLSNRTFEEDLGGTYDVSAMFAGDVIGWAISPTVAGVTISDGIITVSTSAAAMATDFTVTAQGEFADASDVIRITVASDVWDMTAGDETVIASSTATPTTPSPTAGNETILVE